MNAHFNGRQGSRLTRQRGFSLLEILITLFLLTLWLLASAGVQSASLQFNKAAQFHAGGLLRNGYRGTHASQQDRGDGRQLRL